MKVLFLTLFMLFGVSCFSQEDSIVDVRNFLCLDEQTSYPEYLKYVNDFEIVYYNRWGEVLGKSAEKSGYFQDALFNYKMSEDYEMVVYQINYTTLEGEEKELLGHFILLSLCNCG